jgi:hypothetical protein
MELKVAGGSLAHGSDRQQQITYRMTRTLKPLAFFSRYSWTKPFNPNPSCQSSGVSL